MRFKRVAIGLALAAVACALVGFLRRHSLDFWSNVGIEGAYFNRSVGGTSYAGVMTGNELSPFHPFDSYLWLGAAIGFALSAPVVALVSRATGHAVPRATAPPA